MPHDEFKDTIQLASGAFELPKLDPRICGNYELLRPLGSGGMGKVYLARPVGEERQLAIKTIRANVEEERNVLRFKREYRVLSQLDHPNIIKVFDFFPFNDQYFLVMEYLEGKNLDDWFFPSKESRHPKEITPDRIRSVLKVASRVCQALGYIHARKIIHRDLKPGNIMITKEGRVVLLDFGLGKQMDMSIAQTETGIIVGSIKYMSPEQIKNSRGGLDARADLFSLGIVLYELMTGQLPFDAPDFTSVLMKILFEDCRPPSHINAHIPGEVERMILKLLSKDVTARYQSAEDLLGDIGTWLNVPASEEALSASTLNALRVFTPEEPVHQLFEPQFAGRNEEMRDLKALLDASIAGRGQFALVSGESGVGKSRLLQESAFYGKFKGCRVYTGHCYENEIIPFQAFLEILKAVFDRLKGKSAESLRSILGRSGHLLGRLLHEFQDLDLPQPETSGSITPEQEKLHLFNSLAGLFRHLAEEAPLVLCIEDLQWADKPSLELLHYLVRNLVFRGEEATDAAGPKIFIAATYREEDLESGHPLHQLRQGLARLQCVKTLHVRRLNQAEVAEMLQSMLSIPEPPRRLVERIFLETEGNPFFVKEIIKGLVEERVLVWKEGSWTLDVSIPSALTSSRVSGTGSFDTWQALHIPSNVKALLEKRLLRLDEEDLKLLRMAAVIGKVFNFDILHSVSEMEEDDIFDALDRLLKAQVILEKPDPHEELYEFYHLKLKDILLETVNKRRLVRIHAKVGEAIEEHYAGRLTGHFPALAFHFAQAKVTGKAWRYAEKAGDQAVGSYDNEAALEYYQEAVALLESPEEGEASPPADALARLLGKAGAVAFRIGRYGLAEEWLGRMLETAEWAGLGKEAAEACTQLGDVTFAGTRYDHSEEWYQRALAKYGSLDNRPGVATVTQKLGNLSRAKGDFETAQTRMTQALELCRTLGDDRGIGTCLNNIGIIAFSQGKLDKALELYSQALEIRQRAGLKLEAASTLSNISGISMMKGQFDKALVSLNQALKAFHEAGAIREEGMILSNIGITYLNQGKLQEALDYCRSSLKIFQEINDKPTISSNYNTIGEVHYHLCDYEEALKAFQETFQISKEIGNKYDELYYYLNGGLAHLGLGHLDTAQRFFEMARTLGEVLQHPQAIGKAWCYEAQVDIFRQEFEKVRLALDAAIKQARILNDREMEFEILGTESLAAFRAGNFTEAQTHAEKMLGMNDVVTTPQTQAQAHLSIGRSHYGLQQFDAAMEAFKRAENALAGHRYPDLEWQVAHALGKTFLVLGDLRPAVDYYSKAQNILYSVHHKLGDSAAKDSLLERPDRLAFLQEVHHVIELSQEKAGSS